MYIYIIREGKSLFKLGISKDPEKRLKQIQVAIPTARLYMTAPVTYKQAVILEKSLHRHYQHKRYNGFSNSGKTEWFELYYPFFAVWCLICAKIKYLFLWLCLVALIAAACYGLISWVSK